MTQNIFINAEVLDEIQAKVDKLIASLNQADKLMRQISRFNAPRIEPGDIPHEDIWKLRWNVLNQEITCEDKS